MKPTPSLLDRLVSTLFTKSPRSTKRSRVSSKSRLRSVAEFAGAFLLAASFFAAPASAQYGLPSFTVGATDGSTTVVGFGGHQWYVTKDNTGSVELLYKWDDATNFGAVQYNSSGLNEYGGGELQSKMVDIVNGFSGQEQAVLTARNITDVNGGDVNNQKLWALSLDEWNDPTTGVKGDALNFPSNVGNMNNWFWLRSPLDFLDLAFVGGSGGGDVLDIVSNSVAVRPASDLNLSSVIFTSTNDVANGKSQAATGGDWYSYTPARDIKFTFLDVYNATNNTTGQKTPNLTLKADMKFDFSGATTGTNQYVSGLLHGTGLTDYYAKFAETTASDSGSFSTPTTITGDGVYAFDIFCEQANGVNYSDFMGKPVQFELTVSGGEAKDLTLVSTDIAFGLDGGTIGLKDGSNYTQTWTLGTTGTNTINVKPGESSTISGVMSGNGGFTKTGTGTLTLSGANDYTGATVVSAGTLKGNIASATDLNVAAGATYDANGTARTIGALTGSGTVAMGGQALTVGSGTFGGEISGTGTTLTKTGPGTLWLSGANSYTGGTVLSGGALGLGNDTALGTWAAGDPEDTQTGMLLVTADDGKILVTEDRTITNHFQLGTLADRTGALTFDIADGKTLTITGVDTTGTNGYREHGGAINVNVFSTDGTTSPLRFTGGHLVFSNNKANNGGAVGAGFSGTDQHSALDFRGLASLTFTDNIADTGYGGGIYSASIFSSSVSLGVSSTFTDNIAGNTSSGFGGGIFSGSFSSSSVHLDTNAYFASNRAGGNNEGGQGGAIYVYSDSGESTVSLSGHTFFKGNLVSQDTIDAFGSLGGAIYVDGGIGSKITLDSTAGAIAFSGNLVGVDTTGGVIGTTGDANSIHLERNTQLELLGDGNVYFDDSISSGDDGGNSLTKSGTGFVQFLGDNVLNTAGGSGNTVDIQAGTFRLADNATFDASGAGAFNVDTAATLAGQGTITAGSDGFTISGTISPDSDRFEIPDFDTTTNTFDTGRTELDPTKRIGTLTLVGNVIFSDAMIVVDTDATTNDRVIVGGAASIEAGKSLSLGVGPTASLTANSFDFNTTGKLNITGYTPGTNVGSNVQTVIATTGGVSYFNPSVTVAGQATTDFLSASAYLDTDEKNVVVETRLTWNSTDPNRKAHGDFTIADGETFVLGAVLNDNSASANKRAGWDGNSLTKKGDGTLTLTDANTYDGPTTVSAGTLALSGSGSIADSKGVDLASGTSFDISGISATETSIKELSGSGDVNLGDKNLEIGSGNTSTTLSGNISGLGGSLTKTGTGTLILSGANTYTGGTEIEDGKIVAKNASALGSGDVYIHADKTLDLDFEGIFTNEIRDSAGMDTTLNVKNNVAINHANPNFTGTTNVDSEKTLTLGHEDALVGSAVKLASGSTLDVKQASNVRSLADEGATINLTVDAAKPNDAAITAADGFDLDDDTTLVVDVANADQLEKGKGNAKRILVLDGKGADEFGGTASLHSSLSRVRFSLDTATADELAYLLWLAGYADAYNSRLSRNGVRMTSLIDNLPTGNGFLDRLDSLTDDAAIISGIENSTGEGYAASMQGNVKLQQVFNDYLLARKTFTGGDQKRVILGQCDPCGPVCGRRSSYELWGQFTGGSHDRSNIGRYSGYDLSNYGVAFGIERELGHRWFGGVAFGYDNATLKLDDRHAKDEFEAFRASLYGGYAGRNWYASGYAGYSKNWHDMKRNNYALGFSNRGKYDDDVFSTGLELGKVLKLRNGAQFIPSIGVHWIHLDNPAFTERGSMESALCLSKSHYDSVRLPIGARLNRTFTGQRIAWTPEVRAFYVAELADTRAGLNTAFASSAGIGSVFADSGSSGRSGGMFGTGVMAQLTSRLSVGIDYDYEVWEHYDRHNLTGNVTVRW